VRTTTRPEGRNGGIATVSDVAVAVWTTARVPPTLTVLAWGSVENPVPRTVNVPVAGSRVGVTPVTVGAPAARVNVPAVTVAAPRVTVTGPVVTPVGAFTVTVLGVIAVGVAATVPNLTVVPAPKPVP
jgi:hypothetical protein